MTVFAKRKATRRIVYHCTASKEGVDIGVKEVDREHRVQGWTGCGYHFVIRLNGVVEVGRPVDTIGAHVAGFNSDSISISYVGGVDKNLKPKDTRTPAQKAAMADLTRKLLAQYPGCEVVGHRDLSPDRNHDGRITPDEWIKQCPCFDARAWWKSAQADHPVPLKGNLYVVEKGDTLYAIARRFNTTVETLATVSKIDPNLPLSVGQKLTIPS